MSNPPQPVFHTSPMATQPFVIPACPMDQGTIQMLEYRIQCRFVKASVVVYPSPDDRVEHSRQIIDRPVRFQMDSPVSYLVAHGLCSFVADTGCEVDEKLAIAILRSPRTEGITEKIKLCFPIIRPAVIILAVDNTRFVWMQLQAALIKTLMQPRKQAFGLHLGPTVRYRIICIACPWIVRIFPDHPLVKHIVYEQIR